MTTTYNTLTPAQQLVIDAIAKGTIDLDGGHVAGANADAATFYAAGVSSSNLSNLVVKGVFTRTKNLVALTAMGAAIVAERVPGFVPEAKVTKITAKADKAKATKAPKAPRAAGRKFSHKLHCSHSLTPEAREACRLDPKSPYAKWVASGALKAGAEFVTVDDDE